MNKKIYIECECSIKDHLLVAEIFDMGETSKETMVCIYTQLNQFLPLYKRFWLAIKYIFSADAGWDTTILSPVNAYFLDSSKQQAVLIIYKFIY